MTPVLYSTCGHLWYYKNILHVFVTLLQDTHILSNNHIKSSLLCIWPTPTALIMWQSHRSKYLSKLLIILCCNQIEKVSECVYMHHPAHGPHVLSWQITGLMLLIGKVTHSNILSIFSSSILAYSLSKTEDLKNKNKNKKHDSQVHVNSLW